MATGLGKQTPWQTDANLCLTIIKPECYARDDDLPDKSDNSVLVTSIFDSSSSRRQIPDLIKNKLAQHLPAQTVLQERFLQKTIEEREIKKDI